MGGEAPRRSAFVAHFMSLAITTALKEKRRIFVEKTGRLSTTMRVTLIDDRADAD